MSFNLIYTARVQFGRSTADAAEEPDHLRMRLVARPGRGPILVVRFRGQPAPGAVVKLFPEEGEPVELKTDAEGRLDHALIAKERTAFLGKWSEKSPGKRDGKSYGEVRYYATLTIAPAVTAKPPAAAKSPSGAAFAVLPEAVNSFGGAVLGDWLYVYSGHTGQTHHYDQSTTTKHFRRLNLKDRTRWEELPCGPALQGVVLLADQYSLYRIGGMAAHNRPGQPNDLESVAELRGTTRGRGHGLRCRQCRRRDRHTMPFSSAARSTWLAAGASPVAGLKMPSSSTRRWYSTWLKMTNTGRACRHPRSVDRPWPPRRSRERFILWGD